MDGNERLSCENCCVGLPSAIKGEGGTQLQLLAGNEKGEKQVQYWVHGFQASYAYRSLLLERNALYCIAKFALVPKLGACELGDFEPQILSSSSSSSSFNAHVPKFGTQFYKLPIVIGEQSLLHNFFIASFSEFSKKILISVISPPLGNNSLIFAFLSILYANAARVGTRFQQLSIIIGQPNSLRSFFITSFSELLKKIWLWGT